MNGYNSHFWKQFIVSNLLIAIQHLRRCRDFEENNRYTQNTELDGDLGIKLLSHPYTYPKTGAHFSGAWSINKNQFLQNVMIATDAQQQKARIKLINAGIEQ